MYWYSRPCNAVCNKNFHDLKDVYFPLQVAVQLEDLKSTIEMKEATIEELKSRLRKPPSPEQSTDIMPTSEKNISHLIQGLKERDEKIEELQETLTQASK